MIYTDNDLLQFITSQKRITRPPYNEMKMEGAYTRNDMELESLDGKHGFRAFMRQNLDFSENFSIGMDYLPKEEPGSFCLIRCNGIHGGHKMHLHHLNCHIHRSKSEDVNAGLRMERHIEQPVAYAAFHDALRYFLRTVNVQEADLSQYFQKLFQGDLFGGET